MFWFLALAVGLVSSKPLVEKNQTIDLICPGSPVLWQVNQNGSLICNLRGLVPNENNTLLIDVIKTQDVCGKQRQMPTAAVRENVFENNTKIIEITFEKVTWFVAGDYLLMVSLKNITKQKKFSIEVYDVPVLPQVSAINYTVYPSSGSATFSFYALMPKLNKCAKKLEKVSYIASYVAKGCIIDKMQGDFVCKIVQDTDLKDRDVVCYSESLLVCQNEDLKFCRLQINLTAKNNIGNTSMLNFTSQMIYKGVNPSVVNLNLRTRSSKNLRIVWRKPCDAYDYSYIIKYWQQGNSTMQKMMPFSPINDGNSPSYSVSNLKPATSYKICVAAKNLGNYLLSKESCITRETMEDIPSKPPIITGQEGIKNGEENIRWDVKIFWELPDERFWNGKTHLIVEHIETRRPNSADKSKNLSANTKNYTLKNLYKDRDYSVRVRLCTSKGCNDSSWHYIPHITKTDSTRWWIPFLISFVILVILVIGALAIWMKCRKSKKYGELKEDSPEAPNRDKVQVVGPRTQPHDYEEPGEPPQGYDQFPVNDHQDSQPKEADMESDHDERLDSGQLQFQNDDIQNDVIGTNEEIELVSSKPANPSPPMF